MLFQCDWRSRPSTAWVSAGTFTAAATTPTTNASRTTCSATPVVELAIPMTSDTRMAASTSKTSTLTIRINVLMVRGYSQRRSRVGLATASLAHRHERGRTAACEDVGSRLSVGTDDGAHLREQVAELAAAP